MLFEEFFEKEVFSYERPKWAGKMPELVPGEGKFRSDDYRMPRLVSRPDNVIMRDQVWGTRVRAGPGIPYPIIDSRPSFGKLAPWHWNPTDWREFFSPILITYVISRIFDFKFRPISTFAFVIPVGSYWGSKNVSKRLMGESYNRTEFRKYVGDVPEVEEYYDKVRDFKSRSYYHNLFTWKAFEMQMGWNHSPPSFYTPKLAKFMNDKFSYNLE